MCALAPNLLVVVRGHLEYVCQHRKISVLYVDDATVVADFVAQQHMFVANSLATSAHGSATLVKPQSRTTIRKPSLRSFLASETQMAIWNRSTAG